MRRGWIGWWRVTDRLWRLRPAVETAATKARSPPARTGNIRSLPARPPVRGWSGFGRRDRGTSTLRQPYTQLYIHLVWSTWDRLPLLTPELKATVYVCIQAECHALNTDVIATGGIEDHVHLLVRIPTTISIADLVKQIKGASSHLV